MAYSWSACVKWLETMPSDMKNDVCIESFEVARQSISVITRAKSTFAVSVNKYLGVCPIYCSIEESVLYNVCYLSCFPTWASIQKTQRKKSLKIDGHWSTSPLFWGYNELEIAETEQIPAVKMRMISEQLDDIASHVVQ